MTFRRYRPSRLELITLAIIAAGILYQLLPPPIVGLADNGDYARLSGYFGIDYTTDNYEERYFNFIRSKFAVIPDRKWHSGQHTSAVIPVAASFFINRLISGDGLFDIRVLGATYTLLFLLAIWTILYAARGLGRGVSFALALLLIVVCTDVGYVAYFNSFYSEPASLIFYCFTVGLSLSLARIPRPTIVHLAAYYLAALLFLTAKPQDSLLAPLLALLGLWLSRSYLRATSSAISGRWRRCAAFGLAGALCILAGGYYLREPRSSREVNLYNVVFNEILRTSPAPGEDLKSLGLSSALEPYAGTTAFPAIPIREPDLKDAFFRNIGYRKILVFYAGHSDRLLNLVARASAQSFELRVSYLGNFERSAEFPAKAHSQAFSLWSNLKEQLLPKTTWFVLSFLIGGCLLCLYISRYFKANSLRGTPVLMIFLLGMAAIQFFAAVIGEGELDVGKHLFLFNTLVDACLVIYGLWLVSLVALLMRGRRSGAVGPVSNGGERPQRVPERAETAVLPGPLHGQAGRYDVQPQNGAPESTRVEFDVRP